MATNAIRLRQVCLRGLQLYSFIEQAGAGGEVGGGFRCSLVRGKGEQKKKICVFEQRADRCRGLCVLEKACS